MFFLVRLTVCVLVMWTVVGAAARAADKGALSPEADQKKAQILRLFEARPPSAAVDAAIQSVADSRYAAGDPVRNEFVSRMQLAVDYDVIEAEAIQAMMGIYTLPELTAMADYYTSPLGRAAEGKGPALRAKIAPKLKEMLDKGVLNVITSPSPAESVSNAGQ